MKQAIESLSRAIQSIYPDASIEHITMFADSLTRYRDNLSKRTKKRPYKAKDIIIILKHN